MSYSSDDKHLSNAKFYMVVAFGMVAQRVNDWVAEADWETRCETKEAASQERYYE